MRPKLRRLAELEKQIGPYLQRQAEKKKARREWEVEAANDHAIRLGALVLRGEPKLDEDLESAWVRCLTNFDVISAVEEGKQIGFDDIFYLQKLVLRELSGETKLQKFQHLFDIAPAWLLKFTRAILTASILGIKCRDLSGPPHEGHIGFREGFKWPALPNGTLQAGHLGPRVKTLTSEEFMELLALLEKPKEEWSRHDRRRWRELNRRIDVELGKGWFELTLSARKAYDDRVLPRPPKEPA